MAISKEERNDAKDEVRSEYMRARSRVDNEISRRVSSGFSRLRAIAGIALELQRGNYAALRSPTHPGSSQNPTPSVVTIRRIVEDLFHQTLADRHGTQRPPDTIPSSAGTARSSASSSQVISPIISPAQRRSNPARVVNLGNSVRNLGPVFGLRSPDYRRDERESQNRRTWRDESYNNLRLMADVAETRKRNTVEEIRAANGLPPRVDADIPEYQYNTSTFRPWNLTLKQAIIVMNTFDFDLHYRKIKKTFLRYSIKICGLEPCSDEDLQISVFLFIEKYFKFQPVIEMCARPVEDPADGSAVGVLFERMVSAARIFNNRHVLANTQYSVVINSAADWIIWNYNG